jgi:cation diffusion facilitator CzcD-associated flavoprotein CzcO
MNIAPRNKERDDSTDGVRLDAAVVIIGSGFGGQCAAVLLQRRGIDDVLILERRDFMGGTWVQNAYPGAAVDVPSPLYSLSFEPYPWTRLFAERDELEQYTEHVIETYRLREKTRCRSTVIGLSWDEENRHWEVRLQGGDVVRAQFVVNASGPLSTPVIPNFAGMERFSGRSFHTNEWDHDYDLSGRRVAIIGSGASAAQVIPSIVDEVAELHVFQRTPHWVMPRRDRVFSEWERRLLEHAPVRQLQRWAIYWSLELRVVGMKYSERLMKLFAETSARRLLRQQVKCADMRAKLTPDSTIGCKRIILSNTLYPALTHPNTTLHDRTSSVERFTESGISTTDGQHVELDAVIFATGYDPTDGMIAYDVVGKEGRSLKDAWSDFPRAYLGTTLPGFPNFFVVTGPNTGIGHTSALFIIEAQMRYIVDSITKVRDAGARTVEVREEAEEEYTAMIHREMKRTVWQSGGCDSWYKSRSGRVIAMFPGFSFSFRHLARRMNPAHHVVS